MTGILRQQSKIFAENAPIRLVTAFRTAGDNPTQSKTPDVIQNETYSVGWINADNTGNLIPYAEDMNGVLYTLSYNTSYLFEKGMPEYSPEQTYYENSFCQYGGYLYRCKVDETLNIAPTNTNYWDKIETDAYSATNIGTGEGFYASTSGTQFRFKTLIAADDSIVVDSGDDYVSIRAIAATPDLNATSPLSYNAGTLSIQAANSSQSGYLTAADWASFNGKLSSTIFSSANTWSAKNTFSGEVEANALYTTRLKTDYDSTLGSHINHYYTDSTNTETLWLVDGYDNGLTNLGLIPAVNNAVLGTSTDKWDSLFVNDVYTDWIKPTSWTPLVGQVDIGEAQTYSDSSRPHEPILSVKFYRDLTNIVQIEAVLPSERTSHNTNLRFLGDETHYWNEAYFSRTRTNSLLPMTTGGDIGSSSKYYSNIYASNVYFSANNIIADDPNSTGLYIGWKNSSNTGRYVRFSEDAVLPVAPIDLGGTGFKWNNGYFSSKIFVGAGSTNGIYLSSDTSHSYIKDITANTLVLHATGSTQVHVNGNHRFTFGNDIFNPIGGSSNSINLGASGTGYRWNTIYYVTLNPPSDIRLKENIEPLESGLKIVNDLDIKSFTFKNSPDHIEYGIIAQDIVEKYPELISVPDSEDGTYGTYLHNFIFASLRAIQELSAEVETLKQKLREIRNED